MSHLTEALARAQGEHRQALDWFVKNSTAGVVRLCLDSRDLKRDWTPEIQRQQRDIKELEAPKTSDHHCHPLPS
jgi:hypothetical protein